MLFDPDFADEMRSELSTKGSARIIDRNGRSLYLINSRLLQLDFSGLILAYEGYGAVTILLDRPLNGFRLVSSGFPFQIAEGLAQFINLVTRVAVIPVANSALLAKALPSPKSAKKRPKRAKVNKESVT